MNRYALEIYKWLSRTPDWVSGEEIALALGISRVAVSRQVAKLKEQGFVISASPRLGYRLAGKAMFNAYTLQAALDEAVLDVGPLLFLEETASTNLEAKRAEQERGLVVARCQSGGRGRKGRVFSSDPGGLYFSYYFRPRKLSPFDSLKSVLCSGLSVTDALGDMGIPAGLKWPNDVLFEGKKVCGILCEMVCSADAVQRLILGIGVNVNNRLPAELDAACGLKEILGAEQDLNLVAVHCLRALLRRIELLETDPAALMEDYRKRCLSLGQEVAVIGEDRRFIGRCTRVDEDGFLWVKTSEGEERVITADVSIRPAGEGAKS